MRYHKTRYAPYLFFVTLWVALLVILVGPLSATGPLAGLRLAERLGLDEVGKVGRIVMLYHSLAIPFVAALVYLMLDALPFDERYARIVRPTVTAGFLLTSVGGLSFAYLRAGWIAHGVFLVGLSLTFYAGVVLWLGLSPWRVPEENRRLERWAFWLMALFTLISAVIGGATGAYFGQGFQAFLAEDVLRAEHDLFQRAIIAHLHIMLTLIDVALLLLIARRVGLSGRAYRAALPIIIAGTPIITFATWSVMVVEGAHKVINVGAAVLLTGAAIVALYGMRGLIQEYRDRSPLRALLSDPVRFGMLFQLLFVNLVVTGPGIWVAFNLEAVRAGDAAWERAIAVGHWHVLATLSAAIGFLLVVDRLGVQGWLRQLTGWGVLVGSIAAFVAVQLYMFRPPGTAPAHAVILALDAGVSLFLVGIAVFGVGGLLRSRPRDETRRNL